MLRLTLFVCLALLPTQGWGAIAYVGSNTGGSGGTNSISFAYDPAAGNLIEVDVCIDSPTVTVSTVVDSYGATYVFRGGITKTGTRTEKWSTAATGSVAGSGGNITVTLSGATNAAAVGTTRSGVVALGPVTTASGAGAGGTISVTTQDNNNWVSVAFGLLSTIAQTATAGTLRAQSNVGNALVVNNDNTAASPSSVTNSLNNGATDWGAVAMELRTSAASAASTRSMMLLGVGP